jgi:hypothetical protein
MKHGGETGGGKTGDSSEQRYAETPDLNDDAMIDDEMQD